MIRAFVAIELPEEQRRGLAVMIDKLRQLDLHGRLVKVDSMHLTLKFLGHIEPSRLTDIEPELRKAGSSTPPFDLQVAGVGVFPHLARPRVVWAGVEGPSALFSLQKQVEHNLEALGFEAEKRAFHPHLTLMRLKSSRNLKELIRYVEGAGREEGAGRFPVSEFHLFQSILKPQGAEYSKLASVALSGG